MISTKQKKASASEGKERKGKGSKGKEREGKEEEGKKGRDRNGMRHACVSANEKEGKEGKEGKEWEEMGRDGKGWEACSPACAASDALGSVRKAQNKGA